MGFRPADEGVDSRASSIAGQGRGQGQGQVPVSIRSTKGALPHKAEEGERRSQAGVVGMSDTGVAQLDRAANHTVCLLLHMGVRH